MLLISFGISSQYITLCDKPLTQELTVCKIKTNGCIICLMGKIWKIGSKNTDSVQPLASAEYILIKGKQQCEGSESWQPRGSGISSTSPDSGQYTFFPNHFNFLSFRTEHRTGKSQFSCLTVWPFKQHLGFNCPKSIPVSRPGWSPQKEPFCHQWHFSPCWLPSVLAPSCFARPHTRSLVCFPWHCFPCHTQGTGTKEFCLLSEKGTAGFNGNCHKPVLTGEAGGFWQTENIFNWQQQSLYLSQGCVLFEDILTNMFSLADEVEDMIALFIKKLPVEAGSISSDTKQVSHQNHGGSHWYSQYFYTERGDKIKSIFSLCIRKQQIETNPLNSWGKAVI